MIQRHGSQHGVVEWGYTSSEPYDDPSNQVQVDVVFSDPEGREWRVPAYWAGEDEWRVRFSPRLVGEYTYRTVCSDESNVGLHDQRGILIASPYEGDRPLQRHGPLRVSDSQRHLEHLDGTPFFWLADTWWLGATQRLSWPEGFQRLTADRVAKDFSVVQIIAGLPCDMPAFDPRATNEAGHPWEADYARINPAFFDLMDLRIQWLVRSGLVPCIYGAFSFHLMWMGAEKMAQHWRYLVARYGAYPVLWCVAGCVPMPYYLSENWAEDSQRVQEGWQELAGYVRKVDPYGHPVLMEPLPFAQPLGAEATAELLDGYLMHTGTAGPGEEAQVTSFVRETISLQPSKPVILTEGGFEGMRGCAAENERFYFWAMALLGVAGYSYGAAGLWQFNNEGDLYGPAPYGATQSNTLWNDAYQLPGSRQVGLGKRFLERYPWWRFEYHPEWVQPHADEADPLNPYAAGIPGEVRVVYLPKTLFPAPWGAPVTLVGLEPDVCYRALFFDPIKGGTHELPMVTGSDTWLVPSTPILQDWVLVLERCGR